MRQRKVLYATCLRLCFAAKKNIGNVISSKRIGFMLDLHFGDWTCGKGYIQLILISESVVAYDCNTAVVGFN